MFDRISEGRWWDRAWSLVEGCTPCSPGCDHCWLQAMNRRFSPRRAEGWVEFRTDRLTLPASVKKPTAWAIWSDLLHEDIIAEGLTATLSYIRHVPRHRYLLLTKRAESLHLLTEHYRAGAFPPWLWVGVTVCNQEEADANIPLLLQVPAAVRFVSYEPALGPVDFTPWLYDAYCENCNRRFSWKESAKATRLQCKCGASAEYSTSGCVQTERLSWVIAGGESGPGARPAHPDWFRSVRNQCAAAGVPFLFKQWGEWCASDQEHVASHVYGTDAIYDRNDEMRRFGKKAAGRLLDGVDHNGLPEVRP